MIDRGRIIKAGFNAFIAAEAIFIYSNIDKIHRQFISAANSLNEEAGRYVAMGFTSIATGLLGAVDVMLSQMFWINAASFLTLAVGVGATCFALYNVGKAFVNIKQ